MSKKGNIKKSTKELNSVLLAVALVLIIGIICGSIIIHKAGVNNDSSNSDSGIVDDLPDRFKN